MEMKRNGDKELKVEDSREEEGHVNPGDLFDMILSKVGGGGRYQRWLLYAVLTPPLLFEPFFLMNYIFQFAIPDHWCKGPSGLMGESLESWKNSNIPSEIGPDGLSRFSQCQILRNDTSTPMDCPKGWDFDRSDYEKTMATEFEWVCSRAHFATAVMTIKSFGSATGKVLLGQLSDRFGRKPVCFIALFLTLIFELTSYALPRHFLWFNILHFLRALTACTLIPLPTTIIFELSDKSYRAWIFSYSWAGWCIGCSFLPLLAYYVRNWYTLGLCTTLPGFLLFGLYWCLPESPRWLASRGRTKEALGVLMSMAKTNGHTVDPRELEISLDVIAETQRNSPKMAIWSLFTRRRLAINTILLSLTMSVAHIVYYGLTINVTNMSGNVYLNFFLMTIVELPSGWVGYLLADKWGRRWSNVGALSVTALTSVSAAVAAVHPEMVVLSLFSVLMAKFVINVVFLIIYIQLTELYPTLLRSTGNGFCGTLNQIVTSITPLTIYLGYYHKGIPYYIMGLLSIGGVVSSAFIPETLGRSLPETLDEVDAFAKDDKFWSFNRPSKVKENAESDQKKVYDGTK